MVSVHEGALAKIPRSHLAQVDLVPATSADEPIVANLLQLYIYDFSEIIALEVGADGRFAYPQLPRYWSESSRYPFLAAVHGRWAGLVFVRAEAEPVPVWDMAEFFVMRGYRRQGVGTRLAHLAFQRFPGEWQVRVMESNYAARHFWERAIEEFTGRPPESTRADADGGLRHVYRFESKPAFSRGPDTLIPSMG
ncbi:GNAT family N-acetyltransferase [Acidobacteria bacterium AB60]|nr:GNAT family N-acetyltransferase [Acidobacteria bacterium AB60]